MTSALAEMIRRLGRLPAGSPCTAKGLLVVQRLSRLLFCQEPALSLPGGYAYLSCIAVVAMGFLLPHLAGVIGEGAAATAGLLLVTARRGNCAGRTDQETLIHFSQGRPPVDTISGSQLPNLKEGWPHRSATSPGGG